MSIKDFTFTQDYVTSRTNNWKEDLAHLAGKPNIKGLEIGIFEGRSVQFWFQNILTHKTSTLVGVDPWKAKFADNLEKLEADPEVSHRFTFCAKHGQDAMAKMLARGEQGTFDFCYIDGGKDPHTIIETSVMAWRLCKPGAIIIWDDYEWTWKEGQSITHKPMQPPKVGIDAFLTTHLNLYEEVRRGWQITIRKTK